MIPKLPQQVSVSWLKAHFKKLPPGEAIYCLETKTKEDIKCCQQLIQSAKNIPATPVVNGTLPPLI